MAAHHGRLDIKLSPPRTPGTGMNPEQLFAAGWSACFPSATKLVASKKMDAAHQVCPYSRATRGNAPVALNVVTSQVAEAIH
jgi:organic hydroperoxide reductase OsmC/OhrA